MSTAPFPMPPSPWPDRITRDLGTLLLSIAVGFALTFGGGWQLAGQIVPAPEAEISTEQQLARGGLPPVTQFGSGEPAVGGAELLPDELPSDPREALDPADLPIGDS